MTLGSRVGGGEHCGVGLVDISGHGMWYIFNAGRFYFRMIVFDGVYNQLGIV